MGGERVSRGIILRDLVYEGVGGWRFELLVVVVVVAVVWLFVRILHCTKRGFMNVENNT